MNFKKIKMKYPILSFLLYTETIHIDHGDTVDGNKHVPPEHWLLKDSNSNLVHSLWFIHIRAEFTRSNSIMLELDYIC